MNKKMTTLKEKITSKGLILNGSVIESYKRCGKTGCKCSNEDKKYWHGPYWIWTQKIEGKTKTKTLTKDQAKEVKKAIGEMKKVNELIAKWKELSLVEIEKL